MVPGRWDSHKHQSIDHEGGVMCGVPLVDVLVPTERLRAVLEAMRQQGQTQITFEGLRKSCLIALGTDGEAAAGSAAPCAVSEFACAVAAAAAARIVYHYVKLDHVWSMTRDRRDRLYYVSSVLEMLDSIQGHAMLQNKEHEEMDDVVEAVRNGVTPRLRPVAPAAIGSQPCNGGTETFNNDFTRV
jgi:hypothetical protein